MPTEDKAAILAFFGAIVGVLIAGKIDGGFAVIGGAILGALMGYFLGSK